MQNSIFFQKNRSSNDAGVLSQLKSLICSLNQTEYLANAIHLWHRNINWSCILHLHLCEGWEDVLLEGHLIDKS